MKLTIVKCLVDECPCVTIGEFCAAHRDEEAWECDACGELRHDDGKGHDYKQAVHGAMIDPPVEHWVCSNCVAMAEDYEISRMEDRMDYGQEYPKHYDGTGRW